MIEQPWTSEESPYLEDEPEETETCDPVAEAEAADWNPEDERCPF